MELLRAVAEHANGIVTTNSIASTVVAADGQMLFDGQPRGICGDAIREESIRQTATLRAVINDEQLPLELIGVGGISTATHVRDYMAAGAHSVQLAPGPCETRSLVIRFAKHLGALNSEC